MEHRHFTPDEVNRLIPQLEHTFAHIQTCRNRAQELLSRALEVVSTDAPADVARLEVARSQAEFLMEAVQEDIDHILALGGVTKDIEMGLVDFLGEVEGREVWLCWQVGEPAVRYWHPIDQGYISRRMLPSRSNTTIH